MGQNFKDHPQAFVSLQQEAVKSQKLAHPNIVTVHDFDRDGSTIFMTMELLKGDPLDSLLRLEAPFSKEVAMRYFNDLCSGLDYAHKRGLIHSDFKPGNIFVTTGGTVKILDFGIARAANKTAVSYDRGLSHRHGATQAGRRQSSRDCRGYWYRSLPEAGSATSSIRRGWSSSVLSPAACRQRRTVFTVRISPAR